MTIFWIILILVVVLVLFVVGVYNSLVSLKLRTALDAKKRQGLFIGTYASFGYRKDPLNKNKLLVDEEAAEIVREVFNLYVQGYGFTTIAKMMNAKGIKSPEYYQRHTPSNACESSSDFYGADNRS